MHCCVSDVFKCPMNGLTLPSLQLNLFSIINFYSKTFHCVTIANCTIQSKLLLLKILLSKCTCTCTLVLFYVIVGWFVIVLSTADSISTNKIPMNEIIIIQVKPSSPSYHHINKQIIAWELDCCIAHFLFDFNWDRND